ncbi:MAG TPA: GTP 3',8-cyclase MoaA [Vicinamibacterales bacterium]|nr:GTP 3',8-cyclase MoaA [Vicinamibacterales bacterium]
MTILDTLGRPLGSLRISVTDRCNLRCLYCMPEESYAWLPREDILTFEETTLLADLFAEHGATKVRLTGGEPLLRRDIELLVEQLAARPWIEDLAITTNGVLLADHAHALRAAGLQRVTVSLDTLRADRFAAMTRRRDLHSVLRGLDAAAAAGFPLKIDSVVLRGVNDDEVEDLLAFGRERGAEVRFIEYMDVGGATGWSPGQVISRDDILERLSRAHGPIETLEGRGPAPAERYRLADGTTFGIIASTTRPFCRACDRSRLTADGVWLLCLYATHGTDLRRPLRAGASLDTLRDMIAAVWHGRADRGAEERRAMPARGTFVPLASLKRDRHLEMHTRGG